MFVIKFLLVSSLFAGGVTATSTATFQTMEECTTAAQQASAAQQQGPVFTLSCVVSPAVPAQQ